MPIGLRVYFAWVHHNWSARTKTTGLSAALGVGASLGFNSTAGLFAVVTAVVGAAVGANLIVLALGIARNGSVRDLAAATPASPRPAFTRAEA